MPRKDVCAQCSTGFTLYYLDANGKCPKHDYGYVVGDPVVVEVTTVDEPDWIPTGITEPVYTPEYRMPKEMKAVWDATVRRAPYGNILLQGPKGSGKTEGPRALAAMEADMPFTKVDAASMLTPGDWLGAPELIVKDGVAVTHFMESEFARALTQRGCILIDEVNRVRDEMRQILIPILDATRQMTNPFTGQVIHRHPECVIVMTGNIGMQYTGTSAIDPAFTDRSRIVEVAYVEPEIEVEIILGKVPGTPKETAALLVRYATEVRAKADTDPDWPPLSTRQLLAMAEDMQNGLDLQTVVKISYLNSLSREGGTGSTRQQAEVLWTGIGGKQ